MIEVLFTKTDERASVPKNAFNNDAGWDLPVIEKYELTEGHGTDMRTGIAVAIPDGYYGRIVARSSTIRKRGLMVLEGIIDAGFRGELFSYVYKPVAFPGQPSYVQQRSVILPGESVAQLIVQRVEPVYWSFRKELPESERGEQGFGSSGA